jgi:hypothetical protein
METHFHKLHYETETIFETVGLLQQTTAAENAEENTRKPKEEEEADVSLPPDYSPIAKKEKENRKSLLPQQQKACSRAGTTTKDCS